MCLRIRNISIFLTNKALVISLLQFGAKEGTVSGIYPLPVLLLLYENYKRVYCLSQIADNYLNVSLVTSYTFDVSLSETK